MTSRRLTSSIATVVAIWAGYAPIASAQLTPAEEKRIPAAFKASLQAITELKSRTILQDPETQQWHALVCIYSNVAYDIQKTNSLVSPLEAVVEGTVDPSGSAFQPDSLTALTAQLNPSTLMKPIPFRMRYVYSDNGWHLRSTDVKLLSTKERTQRILFGSTEWRDLHGSDKDVVLWRPVIERCLGRVLWDAM